MTISSQNSPVSSSASTLDINVGIKVSSVYPSFDLCMSSEFLCDSFLIYNTTDPAVYPFNLHWIYPSIPTIISQDAPDPIPESLLEIRVKIPCVYPSFYLCMFSVSSLGS